MKMRLLLVAVMFLATQIPIRASEETAKKTAYILDQVGIEEAKFNKLVRGPINMLFHLYDKRLELWTMDPLIRDRWFKNIDDLVNDGLYASRRARQIIEATELASNGANKIRKLDEASEYLNQLRLATSGIKKNITSMQLGMSDRVGTVLAMTRDYEEKNSNDLFLNLDQAEDRLQMIMEHRVGLIEHLIFAAPDILKDCPTRSDIVETCCNIYLIPKTKCLAELKELLLRTNLSYDARCGAISRIIGFHNLAADDIEKRMDLIECSIPIAPRLDKIMTESKKRK